MPENRAHRKRLLILSFSPIHYDARVLKQVRLFAETYDVTTCGFGPSPHPGVHHVELRPPTAPADPRRARVRGLATEALKTAHLYRAAYYRNAFTREARTALRGRSFDAVLANDVEAAVAAMAAFPREKVHADLHEYWPLEGRYHVTGRRRLQLGYYHWLCRVAGRAASTSTVGDGIADHYERKFGYRPLVVPNVPPSHDLEPAPVHDPIRLVHAGAVGRSRGLEKLIDAAAATRTDVTLDLFLTHNNPAVLAELKARAAGVDGVTVHDPVPQEQLVSVLAGFDVGLFVYEPQTINSAWAMPNKIFDYIQARLGVVVGPSPGMSAVVRDTRTGAVTEGFATEDLVRLLDDLHPEQVLSWKMASDAAAKVLNYENVQATWVGAVDAIASRASSGGAAR
jgi:glycosyltransferase involved in cell wall biosynthesis